MGWGCKSRPPPLLWCDIGPALCGDVIDRGRRKTKEGMNDETEESIYYDMRCDCSIFAPSLCKTNNSTYSPPLLVDLLGTLQDQDDPNKYLVLTKWESRRDLDAWLKEPEYLTMVKELDEVLQGPASYRILESPKELTFLL